MPRTIIFANGVLRRPELIRTHLHPSDRIICADGGTRHALALGLTPDLIVGDLDSLAAEMRTELEAAGVRFDIHPVRKDETDLELAIRLAIDDGADEIDLLALLGGRLDQSLANMMLLARPDWSSARLRAVEAHEIAWAVRGGQTARVEGRPGDTLSLIPLTPTVVGVTLTGVEWPLDGARLQFGSTLTVSNVLAAPSAHLQIKDGIVLVIHSKEVM
jgi:thiamine pyrophosphokinase